MYCAAGVLVAYLFYLSYSYNSDIEQVLVVYLFYLSYSYNSDIEQLVCFIRIPMNNIQKIVVGKQPQLSSF